MRFQVGLGGRSAETDLTFNVTVLGSEADRSGFAEFLECTRGRALNNLITVLETQAVK